MRFKKGFAEELPVPDCTVSLRTVEPVLRPNQMRSGRRQNGIFNLNPDRTGLFQELSRVIRPGGVLYGAETVLCEPMGEEERAGLNNWFS